MTFSEFKKIWDSIPVYENGYLKIKWKHPLDLHIGYHTDNSKSFVLMNTGKIGDIPSSFAVSARNIKLTDGTWILEFRLLHESYEDIFLRLCWDMIDFTYESQQPLTDFIMRYKNWQKFLQYMKGDVMSFQRQKGLLGELLYLKEILISMDKEAAVEAWVGPEGSDQDFVFSDTWTEVKSLALSAESVSISSLQQLDQEKDGILEVYFLEKTTPGQNRVALPEVVAQVRRLLRYQERLLDHFDMKLFKYGYREKDELEYKKNYFRLVENRDYVVSSDFPKLTRKKVDIGIESCCYSISLAVLEGHRKR